MNEEELKEFLEKNEKVNLWSEDDIPEWVERANKIGKSVGYREDYNKDGITVESKVVDTGTLEIRSSRHMKKVKPRMVYDFLLDYEYAAEYDDMRYYFEILKEISSSQYIYVYESKSPIPLIFSRRDFVINCFHMKLEDRKYIILLKSVDYGGYPEKGGVVRAWIHYTIYYIFTHPENEEDTLILYLTNTDARGMIPKIITNFLTRKIFPKQINKMSQNLLKYPEYLKRKKEENDDDDEEEDEEEEEEEEEEEGEEESSTQDEEKSESSEEKESEESEESEEESKESEEEEEEEKQE